MKSNVCSAYLIGNQMLIKRDRDVEVPKQFIEHLLQAAYSPRAWGCNDGGKIDIVFSHMDLLESTWKIINIYQILKVTQVNVNFNCNKCLKAEVHGVIIICVREI